MAVIAGFLLTVVRNWTGIQTLRGYPLALLLPFVNLAGGQYVLAALDLGFCIASKLLLLGIGNALFYAGFFG